MAVPTNRGEFKNYCRKRLGEPVVCLNIDDDQVEDRVDDALKYYRDYHYDGTERVYLIHTVAQEDIDNGYITMSELVIEVARILPVGSTFGSALFSYKFHFMRNELFHIAGRSMIPYYLAMRHINMIDDLFEDKIGIRFNRHMNRLQLDTNLSSLVVGSALVIECFRYLDPDIWTDVWSDRWLQRYATALIKRQWGENTKKYNDVQLIGGISFNGQAIYDEAVEEILKLEEDMISSYSIMPLAFTA